MFTSRVHPVFLQRFGGGLHLAKYPVGRAFKRTLPTATALLCVVVGLIYGAILWGARGAREVVTDWYPAGERLGFETDLVSNATRYSQYGFVDLGADFRRPSRAAWSIDAESSGPNTATESVFVVADEPLFYGPNASARVTLCGRRVGEIKAHPSDNGGGPFSADSKREDLLVPPERALGYQFPIQGSSTTCRASRMVEIDGTFAFWRIYRVGLVLEQRRFSPSAIQ